LAEYLNEEYEEEYSDEEGAPIHRFAANHPEELNPEDAGTIAFSSYNRQRQ
jgi:hypothetical protein